MSGPTTGIVIPGSIPVLLAAAAIEAARAVRDSARDGERAAEKHAAQNEAMRKVQEDALRQGAHALREAAAAAEARFASLIALAGQLGMAEKVQAMRPAPSQVAGDGAAYTARLSAAADQVGAMLLAEAARHNGQAAEPFADLALPAAQSTAPPSSRAAAETRFAGLLTLAGQLDMAARVEAMRPAAPQTDDPAEEAAYVAGLNALAGKVETVLLAEAAKRKDQLAELPVNLALPAARQNLAQRQLARIAHLGPVPPAVQALAQELQAAPPGERAELLANELRHSVQTLLTAAEREKVQLATGVVIEQTLKDLGYEVEEIPHTLFVAGGVVHFRRAGWGDYMVRLRVDAAASTVNFNVLRAVEAGANERSALDHIAEDRWCSEFPSLLKALEARGIGIEVTRRLGAGELPVQLVDRNKLPAFKNEEEARPQAQLKARELK